MPAPALEVRHAPRRPLVPCAAALGLGSWTGLLAADGARPQALALGLGLVLLFVLLRTRRGAGGLPLWTLPLAVLAAARVHLDPPLPAPREAPDRTALGEARTRPVVGTWHALSRATGWIDAPLPRDAPRLLFQLTGPLPPDGTRVAALPGEELVPWPRGPFPGPRARSGRFHATGRLQPDELCVLDPWPPPDAGPGGLVSRGRRVLLERAAALDQAVAGRGLLPALLLGSTRSLDPGLEDLFRRTGTRHLLAVSGLHVGLVAWFLAVGLARLRGGPARAAGTLVVVLLLVAYGAACGGRAPVVRATVAIALALCAPHAPAPPGAPVAGRRPDALSLWSLALVLELARDPGGILATGVQLSYLATLGLVLGARTRRSGTSAALVLGPWRSAAQRAARRFTGALLLAVRASAAAVLATLPVTWSGFGELAPVGILATPLALFFLGPLLLLGWPALALPDALLHGPLVALTGALVALLEACDALPGTPVALPPRPVWLVCAVSGACLLWLRAGAPLARRLASLLGAVLLLPWTLAPAGLEVVALDVGAGTCVVARAPSVPAVVFDAGSRTRRQIYAEALGPLLRGWDAGRPVVVLSHRDRDHASALDELAQRHPPRLWIGPRLPDLALPEDAPHLDLGPGSLRVPLAGGLVLRLVRGAPTEDNEGSRSLELRRGTRRILLSGDAEGAGLATLLDRDLLGGPLEVLLFPHHGSDTDWLGELLERCAPARVWISCEGPPAVGPELDRRGLSWRRTDLSGPLVLTAPEKGGNRGAQGL